MLKILIRVIRKPPSYILFRILQEIGMWAERYIAPWRLRSMTSEQLAIVHGYPSVDQWWKAIVRRPYPANLGDSVDQYDLICSDDRQRILEAAERACTNSVDLLGSGLVYMGKSIDWQLDYKSGYRWSPGYCRDLEYGKPDQIGDVKFPWELSRLQWLIPIGQAFLLTGDERFAIKAREIIDSWIDANPYGGSINWSCTMEVALRIFTLTWFVHAFKESLHWRHKIFRGRLLRTIYLHADFAVRHLEKSDINGNHYIADAAGLVYAGLFFGEGKEESRWLRIGWDILCDEFPKQVFDDGVDFEGSIAYHRLVQELFLYPALYRIVSGMSMPDNYCKRLTSMAQFTNAYSRPDGSVPLVGDADDGRVLPFGGQSINDHRYLVGIVGYLLGIDKLVQCHSGSRSEIFWLLGARAANALHEVRVLEDLRASSFFMQGGYLILQNCTDHVFVNSNRLGLGGRGGHSHNDLLSFEAVLDGELLVSDCGAYLYTADYLERNNFRSTAYHNTPSIDKQEINRFLGPNYLWLLHNDATPKIRETLITKEYDQVILSHSGYARLNSPVVVVRTITLRHDERRIVIKDGFEGQNEHLVEIPIHLSRGVQITHIKDNTVLLTKNRKQFFLTWEYSSDWRLDIESGRVSPSYGVCYPIQVLKWTRLGSLASLKIEISSQSRQLINYDNI